MPNKLYVGNLPWSINSESLQEMFAEAGNVTDAFVVTDRETRRSRGFGFVTFETEEEAQKAVEMFNEREVEGRPLVVNVAREKGDE